MKGKVGQILFDLALAFFIVFAVLNRFSKPNNERRLHQPVPLKNSIESILINSQGTYGVVIDNLKTNEGYYLNDHRPFESASLYKLWIMATTYQQIKAGKLSEDDLLIQNVAVLNQEFNIGPADAELQDGIVQMSVHDALEKMITVSDNYAALLLSEKIGLDSVQKFLSVNGFKESSINDPPVTTAHDIALFFEKLYKGELANAEYTTKMINLLKSQQINDVLPKYLPKKTIIAHKTGNLNTVAHDAGIVYIPEGNYIIVLLSESFDTDGAKERMSKISQAVFTYFLNEKKKE